MSFFPLINILKQFNWIDIFILILLFRICYIATKRGLVIEIFKLLGTVSAIYLAAHYYTLLSDWLIGLIQGLVPERIPLDFLDYFSFVMIFLAAYLIFVFLRSIFYEYMKTEAVPMLNRWGSLFIGMGRGILFIGALIFMLVISGVTYFNDSVRDSYMGERVFVILPDTYHWLWEKIMSKFMTKEKVNATILEVTQDFLAE